MLPCLLLIGRLQCDQSKARLPDNRRNSERNEAMKYLYIRIQIQDGAREHTHHCLHTTNCQNLDFAVEWYVAHFWGQGKRDDDLWWFDDEITARFENWKELTKEEYYYLNNLFS